MLFDFRCSFRGLEAMIRRKSTSPAKQAVCRKETGRRLRLWGELGEIGAICSFVAFTDNLQNDGNSQCTVITPEGRVTYQHREDNHFIESGYRAASRDLIECLYSLIYVHNETGTSSYHKSLSA